MVKYIIRSLNCRIPVWRCDDGRTLTRRRWLTSGDYLALRYGIRLKRWEDGMPPSEWAVRSPPSAVLGESHWPI